MDRRNLENLIKGIVREASNLKNKHTDETNAPVNYSCIFSHSSEEYDKLLGTAQATWKLINDTPTGPIFVIDPIETVSGMLKLLKIRIPDSTRPELGDADFTVKNFTEFKKKYLRKECFKLITREDFEMVELMDSDFDVRAYFSNPPLDVKLGVK